MPCWPTTTLHSARPVEASTGCWSIGAGALAGGLFGGRPGRVAPAKGVCAELAMIGLASSGGGSAALCKLNGNCSGSQRTGRCCPEVPPNARGTTYLSMYLDRYLDCQSCATCEWPVALCPRPCPSFLKQHLSHHAAPFFSPCSVKMTDAVSRVAILPSRQVYHSCRVTCGRLVHMIQFRLPLCDNSTARYNCNFFSASLTTDLFAVPVQPQIFQL